MIEKLKTNAVFYIKKLIKKRSFKFLSIFFVLLLIGVQWQNIMVYHEGRKLQYPGQLVEVNNHKMHIYSKGKGSPTVVFTVGSGTPCAYTDFYSIQREISKFARTVSYDRPGYGWSEATTVERSIDKQVEELHLLLNKSGEKPPYVLVGHSLASLEVLRYAQLYSEEVSGILLIDGGNPKFYANYFEVGALLLNKIFAGARVSGLFRALGSIGIETPVVGEGKRYKLLPEQLGIIDRMMFYRNLGNKTNRNEIRNMNENAKKVIANGKLMDIPLVILSSKSVSSWNETQEELRDWSNNSRQRFIDGAGHYIHWDRPDVVIEELLKLIEEIK